VAPVEGARALVEDTARQALDVRDDDVGGAAGPQDARHVGEHPARLVGVLEHGEEAHGVQALGFEACLLERYVEHLEAVLLARVGERPRGELDPDAVPAALPREVEEEPDRAADVEEASAPAVGLEQVEDLAELLAVEGQLPL